MLNRDCSYVAAFVHRLAHVENSTIGARSRVWQFASVIRKSVIGEDCTIASGALVDCARVGERSIVSHGAAVEPGVAIGNDVFIGPGVVFCNDVWPRVSKENFDMAPLLGGKFVTTRVEEGASIGARAVILPGITIGAGAMIAAGRVVDKDVPPLMLLARDGSLVPIDPARKIRRLRAARSVLPVGAE